MSPTEFVTILKDEQKIHPRPEVAAALDAVKAASERKLFRLLRELETGTPLYFREVPARLQTKTRKT